MSLHCSPSKFSAEQALITDLEAQEREVPAISSPCSTSDHSRMSDQHAAKLSMLAEEGSLSERALHKRRLKAQRSLASEFVSALGVRIAALETTLASGSAAEKEAARARRKQLREVQKVAGDAGLPVEERLRALQAALLQQASEAAKADRSLLELRAQLETTTKERDRARAELQTSNALRRKLEDLCRTLQKDNKEVADAAARRSEDDRALQQAMQAKLAGTLEDLQSRIKAQETTLLADTNSLREALAHTTERASLEAQRHAQALNMKDLELQLAQTQLKQKELEQQELAARCAAEVQKTLANAAAERAALLESNETLKQQLEMYSGKFKGFEKVLQESNKVHSTWKSQLEAQQKQMRSLLEERNAAVVDRLKSDKAAAEQQRRLGAQVEALQKLCRVLQARVKSDEAEPTAEGAPDAAGSMPSDNSTSMDESTLLPAAGAASAGTAAAEGSSASDGDAEPAAGSAVAADDATDAAVPQSAVAEDSVDAEGRHAVTGAQGPAEQADAPTGLIATAEGSISNQDSGASFLADQAAVALPSAEVSEEFHEVQSDEVPCQDNAVAQPPAANEAQ